MAKSIPRVHERLIRSRRLALRAVPPPLRLPARYAAIRALGRLEPELGRLSEIAPPGLAVDVGANHGLYSYVLSRLGHEVVAFEPQPWCAETLKAWARGRVRVYDVGLSDHAGTFGLHIPSAGGVRFTGHATFDAIADAGETVQVPVLRLDDFELPGLTFVKIDVEGHEMQVLAGAEQTIKRAMPVLLIEIGAVHRSDAEVLETFERVCGLGYRGEFLLNGRWRPLTEYSIERYQRASLDGDPSAPYVYNFVFRPLTS